MEKSSKKSGLTFLAIGIVMGALCIFFYWRQTNFISKSVTVSGVVEKTQTSDTGDSKEYSVIVSIKDIDGNTRTERINGSSNLESYRKGETIELRYSTESPNSIVIDSFWELWGTILIAGPLSILFLGVGISQLIKSNKN